MRERRKVARLLFSITTDGRRGEKPVSLASPLFLLFERICDFCLCGPHERVKGTYSGLLDRVMGERCGLRGEAGVASSSEQKKRKNHGGSGERECFPCLFSFRNAPPRHQCCLSFPFDGRSIRQKRPLGSDEMRGRSEMAKHERDEEMSIVSLSRDDDDEPTLSRSKSQGFEAHAACFLLALRVLFSPDAPALGPEDIVCLSPDGWNDRSRLARGELSRLDFWEAHNFFFLDNFFSWSRRRRSEKEKLAATSPISFSLQCFSSSCQPLCASHRSRPIANVLNYQKQASLLC